ncbi:SLC13 family permease [Marinobacterium sediminicola]|uniref:TrkA-C domain-containing protein n=1 Tax=Marinobacterium sediminicola TaxID=518898 RepID=A0ABY1S4W5_9GAMM|nr:SLC13 family permease [Marinobacterium sediminicola]ULG68942.1 SLC13 family permease [Marinobacterium sediminicola]SMR78445.1 TrkA-C domain-containing protein [Marinobacterium sediminicola]
MTADMLIVFTLLGGAIALFLSDRIRMDLVALMLVVSLALSGIITPAEAVSGFGEPVVVMIAALFVVGEGLLRTGIASATGSWLLRVGGDSETRLLLFLLPVVALLSAFMSSTGAVALLLPVVMSLSRRSGFAPSRLLMPLAFAALIGGMLTLIGTPPNIIVSGQMRSSGLEPFSFFDFTPIGLAVLVAGMLYLILIARRLLPDHSPEADEREGIRALYERYDLSRQLHKLEVLPGSPLAQKTPAEAALRTEYEVTLIAISRSGGWLSSLIPVLANTRMQYGDQLLVYADHACLERICEEQALRVLDCPSGDVSRLEQSAGLAEVLLPPDSRLCGQTVKQARLRESLGLSVIGLRRNRELSDLHFASTELAAGDTLLLAGSWERIRNLGQGRELVVLNLPPELEEIPTHGSRAPLALGILLAMLVTMTTGWLDNLSAILLAALGMILSGCVNLKEAYRSLNATSLILIAGMLPMALAMERSGALDFMVQHLISLIGNSSPLVLCASMFLITSLLSQFISNTATTVLVAPVALSTAQLLGINPEPVMISVAIAASTAFATPIASPVNTLVLAPGNYRFADFARVGIPLQLLALVLTLTLTPLLFPF